MTFEIVKNTRDAERELRKGATMMTFNKTEREILAQAQRNPYGHVGIEHGCQGPSGRKRHWGHRRVCAAAKLREKGLLERVHGDGGSPLYKNGWGINGVVYSSTWALTEAGKAVAL